MKVTCIYKITNLINGKTYIGQTVNFKKRKRNHLYYLRNGNHFNDFLQRSFDKYGEDNFAFDILELCSAEELDKKECEYINKYNSMCNKNGYNMLTGGQKYRTFSDEVKRKMSESRKRYKMTEKHRMNISKGRKGISMPKDSIRKGIIKRYENQSLWGEKNGNAVISNEVAGWIIDDLIQNMTVKDAMIKYNVSQDTIYNLMYNKTYISVRTEVREELKNRTSNNFNKKLEKAVSLFLEGYSQNEISKMLQMSRNTIRKELIKNGIDTNNNMLTPR